MIQTLLMAWMAMAGPQSTDAARPEVSTSTSTSTSTPTPTPAGSPEAGHPEPFDSAASGRYAQDRRSRRASLCSSQEVWMAGQGSTGNVIAALASFFIPGLGQLIQGRPLLALVMFVLAGLLWLVFLGWIVHLWSIIDAARFSPRR